jgi:hypothetical protein
MEHINKHIVEHYKKNTLIGIITNEGIVDDSKVGYNNRVVITEGNFKFKKKFTATVTEPIIQITYNLYGR